MKKSVLRTLVQTVRAMKMRCHILLLAFIPILFTGCASIIDGGGPQTVNINSSPQGAKVTIYDKRERQMSVKTTPATVVLNRGGLFRKERYRLDFEMPGYRSCETRIEPTINPLYFGNFAFLPFSPIGFLVDPATGAMWMIRSRAISCTLTPSNEH